MRGGEAVFGVASYVCMLGGIFSFRGGIAVFFVLWGGEGGWVGFCWVGVSRVEVGRVRVRDLCRVCRV